MSKIPLIKPDLPTFEQVQGPFREVLENGKVTNFGKYVTQFEAETSAYLGTQTATASSGTMALLFALQAMGLERGQKVILPGFTFMATAQAVLYAGGQPLFAEIEQDMNLSPSDLEALLARHSDVAVVLPVHIYGLPCRVDQIQRLVDDAARQHGHPIRLVYDAAHAFGSAINGRRVGTFGDAEVFSLSVTKALVCVEGGLISTRDTEIIRRFQKMRNYGIEKDYDAHWPGMNGKMSEFHAVVGVQNLRNLDGILSVRSKNASYFIRQIEEKTHFAVLPIPEGVTHTFKDFTVVVPPKFKAKRDAIIRFLGDQGVETRAYFYPPIHEQKLFKRFSDRPLPVTEDLSRRVITVPFFTSISEGQMDEVVGALQRVERSLA